MNLDLQWRLGESGRYASEMNATVYLIAGPTGAGKTTFLETGFSDDQFAKLCYDRVMHDAVPFAFPLRSFDDQWNKAVWENTKRFIDAKSAFKHAISESSELPNLKDQFKIICFGYQLSSAHWRNVILQSIGEITGQRLEHRLCLFLPDFEVVRRNRINRGHSHDQVTEAEMAANYQHYAEHCPQYDILVKTDADISDDVKSFFEIEA